MRREESAGGSVAAEIIRAWQRGEEPATRAVFDVYFPRAARLAALSGMSLDEAQDCAQEAMMQAFERRRQLRDPQAFSLWFHRIATRQMLDTLERRHRGREAPLDDAADLVEDWQRQRAPQPEEQALLAERREALWESIQALAPRYRIALALRYYGEFPLREIAEMLSMREGTLRVTLHRALAQLREQVIERGSGAPTTSSVDCSAEQAKPETTGGRLV